MKWNPWSGIKWILGAMLVLMLVGPLLRVADRTWSENKSNPIVNGTSGVVGDWVKTALGNTGSGGSFSGFGSSGSRALDAEKNLDRAKASVDEAYAVIDDSVLEAQAELDRSLAVQKRKGRNQEWHPRIKWKDVNVTTPGAPIAVSIDVYRCDPALVTTLNQAGVSSTVATFLAKRGDPPTSLSGNVNLMDGVQYAFQAYVPNSNIEASTLIGPYTFIKGKGGGWQSPSGRKSFQEDLELLVNR